MLRDSSRINRVVVPDLRQSPAKGCLVCHKNWMFGDTQHTKRRSSCPHDEISLITKRKSEVIGELAMDDGKENRFFRRRDTGLVRTEAENETERVSCLMPMASFLGDIWFLGINVWDTREFERVGEVCGGQTCAEYFCKCTSPGRYKWIRGIVVNK